MVLGTPNDERSNRHSLSVSCKLGRHGRVSESIARSPWSSQVLHVPVSPARKYEEDDGSIAIETHKTKTKTERSTLEFNPEITVPREIFLLRCGFRVLPQSNELSNAKCCNNASSFHDLMAPRYCPHHNLISRTRNPKRKRKN